MRYTYESRYTKRIWKDRERRERGSKRSKGDGEEKKRRNETKKGTEFGSLRNYGTFTTSILDNTRSTSLCGINNTTVINGLIEDMLSPLEEIMHLQDEDVDRIQ